MNSFMNEHEITLTAAQSSKLDEEVFTGVLNGEYPEPVRPLIAFLRDDNMVRIQDSTGATVAHWYRKILEI